MLELRPDFHDLEADLDVLALHEEGVHNLLCPAGPPGTAALLADLLAAYRRIHPRVRLFVLDGEAPTDPAAFSIQQPSAEEVKAYYLLAHAFLWPGPESAGTLSLERAVACRTPCVAWGGGAGDVPLSWAEGDPRVLAEAARACVVDLALGDRITDWQQDPSQVWRAGNLEATLEAA